MSSQWAPCYTYHCRVASLPPGVKGHPGSRIGCNPLSVESVSEAVTLTRCRWCRQATGGCLSEFLFVVHTRLS